MEHNTLIQYFEWYLPADGSHWRRATRDADALARLGVSHVWLPPAYKGDGGGEDVGYGAYDLYDLGEFDQQGSVPTKYGTREEYLAAVEALHQAGLKVLADIVLNHKLGADSWEEVAVDTFTHYNRCLSVSTEGTIRAWTKYDFPGRSGKYSGFRWNHTHFDGVDWDERTKTNQIYLFDGKSWDCPVDLENGNYDYLMGADLDMGSSEVLAELDRWGRWYYDTVKFDGVRLDAVKHIRFGFFTHWLTRLRQHSGRELMAVGEYWNGDLGTLERYLDESGNVMSLFDVPLHYNFYQASRSGGGYDMRRIFDGTLVNARPDRAVTLVDNHDTQPGQSLESWVDSWFKPLAYAMILLRRSGTPCVFYGDWQGIPHSGIGPVTQLEQLLYARKHYAQGEQIDYLDHPDIIGWTRLGSGMAVILSDGPGGSKKMSVGAKQAGKTYIDLLGSRPEELTIPENGLAEFPVNGGSVSVWVPRE